MSIVDRAKTMAAQLVDKLKGSGSGQQRTTPGATGGRTTPTTTPSSGAVTPADVAESVSDPDLPHPEPPADESPGRPDPA
jgi:hypothetical protein